MDQVQTSAQTHAINFEALSLVCDVIIVTEGRGQGKNSYYEPFQINMTIASIDPKLDEIIHNLNSSKPLQITFKDVFAFRTQDVFHLLYNVILQLGDQAPQFWLNVQLFENLYYDTCLPIDFLGSGNAQVLNRANKSRIDWAIQSQSSFVNLISAQAWDPNFYCTTNNFTVPLYTEIQNDWDRPIINQVGFYQGLCNNVLIRGFNIAETNVTFTVYWQDNNFQPQNRSFNPFSVDPQWGAKNHRSKFMGQAIIETDWDCSKICETCPITYYAINNNKQSNNPYYQEFGTTFKYQ